MTPPVAVILYEDQGAPKTKFGLHDLLIRCACDLSDMPDADRFAMKDKFDGRPMKGVSKIIALIREQLHLLAGNGGRVLAILDNDRIRDALNLPPAATEADVIAKIGAPEKHAQHLTVLLLIENTESVLVAAKKCGAKVDEETYRRALRKELQARDLVLSKVAFSPDKSVRDCIRKALPSFSRIVDAIAGLI